MEHLCLKGIWAGAKPSPSALLVPATAPSCSPHLGEHQSPLEGSFKHTLLGCTPRVSDSIGLEWDPKTRIPNKFLGDTQAAGLESKR